MYLHSPPSDVRSRVIGKPSVAVPVSELPDRLVLLPLALLLSIRLWLAHLRRPAGQLAREGVVRSGSTTRSRRGVVTQSMGRQLVVPLRGC
jgi:hypothetical protein